MEGTKTVAPGTHLGKNRNAVQMLSMERFRDRSFRLLPTWHFVKLLACEAILNELMKIAVC